MVPDGSDTDLAIFVMRDGYILVLYCYYDQELLLYACAQLAPSDAVEPGLVVVKSVLRMALQQNLRSTL